MDERANRKYKRITEIIHHVAECADGKLILVGGTALALFYLNHRLSIDLDFIPVSGDECKLNEALKGCLSKHGYRTATAAHSNQFVVQFGDTSIKIEIFTSEYTIKKVELFPFGIHKINVASLNDILELKFIAYKDRKEARDLYDIVCILKSKNQRFDIIKDLIRESGSPINQNELEKLITDMKSYELYNEVLKNVSKTGD
ncbi:nucleotidyl transferase AbiEii/AbiGii toxin family protein [Candidatus Micrarchaeota archaeon]|nr:nucleotidyl transferase AbiEii/AbiGii toxin family protein [Candidatus Micrarchaeota archaeon]